MADVKVDICLAIQAAIAGVADVGHVSIDQSEDLALAETLARGQRVVELLIGDDEGQDQDRQTGIELFMFSVGCIIHLPGDLAGASALLIAGSACRDIYNLYASLDGVKGQWGDAPSSGPPRARLTNCTMYMGAVIVDGQRGTTCVCHTFDVLYGFAMDNPEEPR